MASDKSLVTIAVFCVTFIGVFTTLLSTMPSEFVTGEINVEYQNIRYPSYFSQEEAAKIKWYLNYTVQVGSVVTYDFASLQAGLPKLMVSWIPGEGIYFDRVTWEWWVFFTLERLDIVGAETKTVYPYLTKTALTDNWFTEYNVSKFIGSKFETLQIFVMDPDTTRNDIAQAFDEGEVHIGIGMGIEDLSTKLSTWGIIASLLTFQAPNVHPLVNALIAIPFWACIAVLTYILILKAIPFVG